MNTNTTTVDLSTLTASQLLQMAQEKEKLEQQIFLNQYTELQAQAIDLGLQLYPIERTEQIAFVLARCEELGIKAHISKRAATNSRPNGMENAVGTDLQLNTSNNSKSLPMLDYLLAECLKLHAAGKIICTGEIVLRALGLDPKAYDRDTLRSALNSIDSGNVSFDRYGVVRHAGRFLGFAKTVTEKVALKQASLFADLPVDFLERYPLSTIGEALPYHKEIGVKHGLVHLPAEKPVTVTAEKPKTKKAKKVA